MTAVETLGASGAAADATSSSGTPAGWVRVCAVSDLELERGRAALIGGEQVALFLCTTAASTRCSSAIPTAARM